MRRSLDSRKLLTILTVSVAGAVLLLLVTPDFFGSGTFHLQLLTILFSLLPLFIIVMLISYAFGKSRDISKKPANGKNAKFAATIASAAGLLSLFFTYLSTKQSLFSANTKHFVFENIATGLLFTAFVMAVALINIQKFVYWPLWSKADRAGADERQQFVRQRVFEKAYRYILISVFVASFLFNLQDHRMRLMLGWTLVLAVLSLPAVIAAWQKDS